MFGFGRFLKRYLTGIKNITHIEEQKKSIAHLTLIYQALDKNTEEIKKEYVKLKLAVKNIEKQFLQKQSYNSVSLAAKEEYDQCLQNKTETARQIVFVATNPRSGSSLLMHALSDNNIIAPYTGAEWLLPNIIDDFYHRWGFLLSDAEYIEKIFHCRTNKNGLLVFKVMWSHYPRFMDLLPLTSCSKILFLERVDKIDQAISWFFGNQTGKFSSFGTEKTRKELVNYNYTELLNTLNTVHQSTINWCELFNSQNIVPRHLVYETDLNYNYKNSISSLVSWISGEEFKAEDIAPPALKIQRDELNQEFKERFIRDLRAHGIDESQYQRLYWPERSRTECR